jgi:hypothetical protein
VRCGDGMGLVSLWIGICHSKLHLSGISIKGAMAKRKRSTSPPVIDRPTTPSDTDSLFDEPAHPPARRTAPPIPGLYLAPTLLPESLANATLDECMRTLGCANQVMLFERAGGGGEGFPGWVGRLIWAVRGVERGGVDGGVFDLLFDAGSGRARQVIVNLYRPGEGIKAHVDLVGRFGDGVVGVSLGSGCVMRFGRVRGAGEYGLYLHPGSVVMMCGEARYGWTHGIEGRVGDVVESVHGDGDGEWVERGVRVSVTFRWLLPGADVVGQ